MGFFRKFKRQQQKEFNYKEYEAQKLREREEKRKARAKAQLLFAWKATLEEHVPIWQLWLALIIPPTWYKKITGKIMSGLMASTEKYAKSVTFRKLPKWRISFNHFMIFLFIRIVNILLIEIVKWIHDLVLTFGFHTTLKEKKYTNKDGHQEYSYEMVIRYFWIELCRKEITC